MWLLFTLFPSVLSSKSFRISARRSRARSFIICLLAIAREIIKDYYRAYQSNLMRVDVNGRVGLLSYPQFLPYVLRQGIFVEEHIVGLVLHECLRHIPYTFVVAFLRAP